MLRVIGEMRSSRVMLGDRKVEMRHLEPAPDPTLMPHPLRQEALSMLSGLGNWKGARG